MSCWIWGIDTNKREWLFSEVENGRLRQGWGDEPQDDLRVIQSALVKRSASGRQLRIWDRLKSILVDVTPGDYIAVRGIPDRHITVVQVTGPYDFQPSLEQEGYGHILPCEALRSILKERIANRQFVYWLNHTGAVTRVSKHEDLVKIFAEGPDDDPAFNRPSDLTARQDAWSRVKDEREREELLRREMSSGDLEDIVEIYMTQRGLENVVKRRGPQEHGADIIADGVVVQVKKHEGVTNCKRVISQLDKALSYYPNVTKVVVATTAQDLDDALKQDLVQFGRQNDVEVWFWRFDANGATEQLL